MNSKYPCIITAFTLVALCIASGCGGNYAPARASDPAIARQTLTLALDAWKSGEKAQVLANQKPELYVGDEDWSGGFVLQNYQLVGDGEPFGSSVRFQVGLELAEKSGGKLQKTVRYIVATNPVCRVQRDDRLD